MTILNLSTTSSSSSTGAKPSSLLSMALKRTIVKAKPYQYVNNTNKHLYEASLALLDNRSTKKQGGKIPLDSYHAIEWNWTYSAATEDDIKLDSEAPLISTDQKSVCFHASCQSCFETNAVRGNRALKSNAFTYWEITVLNEVCSGTSLMIGVGNQNARLNSIGYLNLLGIDENSWGLSHQGFTWHDNKSAKFSEHFSETTSGPVTIGCLFNGFTGQLSYFKNGKYLGVAFEKINTKTQTLFPMISSTVAQSAFRLECVCETFPNLKDLCRETVRAGQIKLDNQNLPVSLLEFLKN